MEFSKHSQRVRNIKEALKVAFAVRPTDEALTPEDVALLEKVATALVDRRMASPAVLFLESVGPMNFLGSQALHVLTPILNLACNTREIERAAHLLERRDAIPRLLSLIEAKSEAKQTTP